MTRTITFWTCVSVTVLVVGYDIAIAIEPTPNDTVSKVLRQLFMDYPVIAFATGVLGGHISSTLRQMLPGWWYWMSLPILGVLVGVLVACSVLKIAPWGRWPLVWVELGLVAGYILWPQ